MQTRLPWKSPLSCHPPVLQLQSLQGKGTGRSPVRLCGPSLCWGSPLKGLGPQRASIFQLAPKRGDQWYTAGGDIRETPNHTAGKRVCDPQTTQTCRQATDSTVGQSPQLFGGWIACKDIRGREARCARSKANPYNGRR